MTLEDLASLFTTIKDIAPWIAILLSSAALWLSVGNYRRDRAILVATSEYVEGWQGYTACMRVNIVNKGRRPIVLTEWVGAATERKTFGRITIKNWVANYFNNQHEGLTLTERQSLSFELDASELDFTLQDDSEAIYDDIWIVDSVKEKHRIKGVRENIAKLRTWAAKPGNHPIGQH